MKNLQTQVKELEDALVKKHGPEFVETVYAKVKTQNGRDFLNVLERLGALAEECVSLVVAPGPGSIRPAAGRPAAPASARPASTAATAALPLGALRTLATGILGSAAIGDKATKAEIDAAFFAAGLSFPGCDFTKLEREFGGKIQFKGFNRSLAATRQAKIDRFFRRWNNS